MADAVIKHTPGLRGSGIAELQAWTADVEQRLAAADDAEHQLAAAANFERDQLREGLDRAQAANVACQRQLDAFAGSTSWKITGPLRAAASLFKGLKL